MHGLTGTRRSVPPRICFAALIFCPVTLLAEVGTRGTESTSQRVGKNRRCQQTCLN